MEDYNQAWWNFIPKYYNVYYHPMHAWPVRDDTPGSAKVWATGQKTSYISGDDGDLEKGALWPNPRFVDNNDGTVTDKLTGLMWTKTNNIAGGNRNWQYAFSYVAGMNSGANENYGYSDWRIPNIKELESLTNASRYNPALSENHPFTITDSLEWSSTSELETPWNAWVYSTYHGYRTIRGKSGNNAFVWAVRGADLPVTIKWPLSGALNDRRTSLVFGSLWSFGECPSGTVKKHVGIDVNADAGEEVYAAYDGVVKNIFTGQHSTWADAIVIEHNNGQFTTVYWHVIKNESLYIGKPVAKGELIAHVADLGGNTHFHFGIRKSAYNASNSLAGALPQSACGGYPAFPEFFVNSKAVVYE